MDDSLPAFRLDDSYRLVSLADDAGAAGWNASLRSEEIGKGWRVNLFDCHTFRDEVRTIEGPATFSISLFIKGTGRLALENGPVLDLQPRSLFLFHAPRPTRGLNQIDAGSHLLGVDFRFAPALLDKIGLHSLGCLMRAFNDNGSVQDALLMRRPLDPVLQRIAEEAIACRMNGAARRVFLQSKALEVLAHVIAFVGDERAEGAMATASLTRRDQSLIRQAAETLRVRYSEPWTISILAREAGINERKLKLGFRQLLGRTVHDHLERTRISVAQNLLTHDGLGVTETALAVGYSNPSHFAKIFKRSVGMSPSVWRRADV
ncbi:MAG: helix-turn-helix transcriptional regulator [Kiloniellaceae bacterium]